MKVKVTQVSEWNTGGVQVTLQGTQGDLGTISRQFEAQDRLDDPTIDTRYVISRVFDFSEAVAK